MSPDGDASVLNTPGAPLNRPATPKHCQSGHGLRVAAGKGVRAALLLGLSHLLCTCGVTPPSIAPVRDALSVEPSLVETPPPAAPALPGFVPFEQLAAAVAPPPGPSAPAAGSDAPAHPTPTEVTEQEPNNDRRAAQEVPVPARIDGRIEPRSGPDGPDADWYAFRIEAERPAVLDLELTGLPGLDLGFDLYHLGLKGEQKLLSVNAGGPGEGEKLPNVRVTNGRYLLHLFAEVPAKPKKAKKKPAGEEKSGYRFSLLLSTDIRNRETEPNDSVADALPLDLPFEVTGSLSSAKDRDLFAVDVLKLSTLSCLALELTPPLGGTVSLTVTTQNREELASLTASKGKKGWLPNLAILEGNTTYYLAIASVEGKPARGEYVLKARNDRLDERTELEPNDRAGTAMRLFYDEPLQGWLPSDPDVDWFFLEPATDWGQEEGEKPEVPALDITVSSLPGADLSLALFDADASTPLGTFNLGGKGDGEEVPNLPMPGQRLYLKLSSAAGSNAQARYTIQARPVST